MITDFTALNLNPKVIEGLKAQNITAPTPIQARTLPAFIEGYDIIAESYTGSGKTLAFVLPLFKKIDASKNEMQAIILAPTHELVMQIHEQIRLLAQNSGIPVTSQPIMGEVNMETQIKKLKNKPHIIVGSAGRVLDLMERKKITAHTIKTVVLDEADNLLGQNQVGTIKRLLHMTRSERQLCIFSASITKQTLDVAKTFMPAPIIIQMAPKTSLNPNIEHMYIVGEKRDKFELLKKLLVAIKVEKALIFVSQNTDVTTILEKLTYHGYKIASISGKVSKEERKNALMRFKKDEVQLLISSDLSARGLDVPDITHVFHFDMPLTAQDYLHRAGRTARGIASGTSICITSPKELGAIRIYEREYNIKFAPITLVKGNIKRLDSGEIIKAQTPKKAKQEAPKSNSRNKYPKGFNSDKKKDKGPKKDAPESNSKQDTPKQTKFKVSKNQLKTATSKKAKENTGTFADIMALIEADAKFGKNYE
ncbi:DEAD/DEAH box helicase [Cellulosilyticum ruminicola]|uniref:DEAD/DEAH box helicase n=1 Tax=Cellulosilyticum ruminicola TaxID=425254 RepID=UPI0006D1ADFD|nr:DEAD/DEAH box helicase [Cellulosilyticum ruminicola]